MKYRLSCFVLLSVAVLGGCSADKKADAAQPREKKEGSVAPRPSVVDVPSTPYRAISVSGGSRLSGTIDFEGDIPPDSVVPIPADTPGCGRTVAAKSVERSGTKIGGVVVWISDIRTGKPLPIQRRFELSNNDCTLTPRVQAVYAPGTLNMASGDVAMHRNRIINVATGETEGIAPFNDNGEVVPFDGILTTPAQLEVTCDLHPWTKAWILVFDHPYFSVTEKNGAFSIEDIPAGTYHVKAWHPVLGLAEQTVTIVAGQPASLSLKLGSVALPAVSPDSGSVSRTSSSKT